MPYVAYLVYGYVYDSLGNIVPNARLYVETSIGKLIATTDSDGIFMYDLANAGYTSGETVDINITEPYNNEYKNHTFVVSGMSLNEDITTSLRTRVEDISDLQQQNVLHSVGKAPITSDNPLSISNETNPLDGYMLAGEDVNNTLYGYVNKSGGWYIQKFTSSDKTYKYVKGSKDFSTNWSNRTSLTYQFPNEVF